MDATVANKVRSHARKRQEINAGMRIETTIFVRDQRIEVRGRNVFGLGSQAPAPIRGKVSAQWPPVISNDKRRDRDEPVEPGRRYRLEHEQTRKQSRAPEGGSKHRYVA